MKGKDAHLLLLYKNVYVKEHISIHEVKHRASYNVTNMMQIELCPLMCICHYYMYSLFEK